MSNRKLLQEMEMEEREAVAARAKAKAKRATCTRRGTGRTASASGTEQKAKVCSTQIFTTFRKFANQVKSYHSCPRQPKVL